jgi:hypothetical protein
MAACVIPQQRGALFLFDAVDARQFPFGFPAGDVDVGVQDRGYCEQSDE